MVCVFNVVWYDSLIPEMLMQHRHSGTTCGRTSLQNKAERVAKGKQERNKFHFCKSKMFYEAKCCLFATKCKNLYKIYSDLTLLTQDILYA